MAPVKGIDSDFVVYNARCEKHDVKSLVDTTIYGQPRFKKHMHIDMANVYGKQIVMNDIFKRKYRTSGLDEVSRAVLGSTGGKYKNLNAIEANKLSVPEQKKYNLRDVDLVKLLAEKNDYNILHIMRRISLKINLPFDRVCATASTRWWEKILNDMSAEAFNPNASKRVLKNRTGKKLQGWFKSKA